MWVIFALMSAFFAGITSILAKVGLKNINSYLATALRTIVVLVFAWIMVFVVGDFSSIKTISAVDMIFIILSGLATGGSWLCYFKALQIGNVNKVVPIDKTSTILTMILAFIFFNEQITSAKIISMIMIGLGTYLMVEKKPSGSDTKGYSWFVYALLSAVFASFTSILGKIGMSEIDSTLGTALRTIVVLIMSWIVVLVTRAHKEKIKLAARDIIFLVTSGIATGLSWLCYFRALKDGQASIVVPIDKMSIVVTIAFSFIFLKERLSYKSSIGLAGTLMLI